jgi:hypothetical protein
MGGDVPISRRIGAGVYSHQCVCGELSLTGCLGKRGRLPEAAWVSSGAPAASRPGGYVAKPGPIGNTNAISARERDTDERGDAGGDGG